MLEQVLIEGYTFQEPGVLTLSFDKTIEIRISSEEAQQIVNQYVHMEISTQMHAEEPTFVIGDDTYWQVPIHLTFPAFGDVGKVGMLQVDPILGEIDTSQPEIIQTIIDNAEQLALRFTSAAAQPV
ncbi:MAG: hypothetical protein AAF702_06950 [Chloroflexota bacterium]